VGWMGSCSIGYHVHLLGIAQRATGDEEGIDSWLAWA